MMHPVTHSTRHLLFRGRDNILERKCEPSILLPTSFVSFGKLLGLSDPVSSFIKWR